MSFLPIVRMAGTAAFLLSSLLSAAQGPPVEIPAAAPLQPVTALEYFFNTDPGTGNATPLAVTPGLSVNASININTAGLAPGVHRFFVRARNSSGQWGLPALSFFYVLNTAVNIAGPQGLSAVSGAEYFLDTDPGFGNGTPIPVTAGNVISLSDIALNIGTPGTGMHKFYIRTRNLNGSWSHTQQAVLNLVDGTLSLPPEEAPAPVVKAEYFFDTDPGFGNGNDLPVTAGTTVFFAGAAAVNALPVGTHKYFVRAQDQRGSWSLSGSGSLSVISATVDLQPHAAQRPVMALEYFIDTDPGFGNGTVSIIPPTANLANYSLSVPVAGLPDGTHQLYIRTLGPSSITTARSFYVGIPLPLDFLDFSVRKEGNAALLRWETAPGFVADRFDVERSTDGRHFSRLAAMPFSEGVTQYAVPDKDIDGLDVPAVYYRVAATGQGGKTVYTGILSLRLAEAESYAYVFPNPVKDILNVHVAFKEGAKLDMQLTDNAGRMVLREERTLGSGSQQLSLDLSRYPAGVYYINLASAGWKRSMKVLKQ